MYIIEIPQDLKRDDSLLKEEVLKLRNKVMPGSSRQNFKLVNSLDRRGLESQFIHYKRILFYLHLYKINRVFKN